jgi:hypothetical protein
MIIHGLEHAQKPEADAFEKAYRELVDALRDFQNLAERGLFACKKLRTQGNGTALRELNEIDQKLLAHPAKEIAAMVFLQKDAEKGTQTNPVEASRQLYQGILEAVRQNLSVITRS